MQEKVPGDRDDLAAAAHRAGGQELVRDERRSQAYWWSWKRRLAHCVSVTWSTLGRQPRARGDTHIWNRCGQPDIGGTAFLIHPVRTVATV